MFKENIKNAKTSLDDIFSKLGSKPSQKKEKTENDRTKNTKTKKIAKGYY